MSINIKNVKGDVIASDNQSGGITGKISHNYNFFTKHKKSVIVCAILFFVGLTAYVSNLTAILDYFNLKLF